MLVARVANSSLVIFSFQGSVYAMDNRCPHMGYPLSKGTLKDGIVTCHWHHARFDLSTGGTFDLFADDVLVYKTLVSGGRVLVKIAENGDDPAKLQSARLSHIDRKLKEGLEHSLNLVIAKSIIQELSARPKDQGVDEILKLTSEFGTLNRLQGWGPGMTILTCMSNVLDHLGGDDMISALVQGASHVSSDCFEEPVRRRLVPLSGGSLVSSEQKDIMIVKSWFRKFVDQREPEAAERALVSAIKLFPKEEVAEMMFSAITDHMFINGGHSFDFTNKAFELLDRIGWERAEAILPSLVRGICNAQRHEEDSEWRNPIDLFSLLLDAEKRVPNLLQSRGKIGSKVNLEVFTRKLLSDDPKSIIQAIEDAISEGCSAREAAEGLACAAATRLARFHIQNEFGDWITVLHSFSYCNAVLQSTRFLKDDGAIFRAVLQGAMNLYLTRFLNIPSANLPDGSVATSSVNLRQSELLDELLASIEHKDVDRSAVIVSEYLRHEFETKALFGTLVHSVVREDAEFHTFQLVEATIRTLDFVSDRDLRRVMLVGAARYIAAHSPTDRSLPQTIKIAQRLQRGEALYEQ